MKYEYYPTVYTKEDLSIFDFVSIGKRGAITKRIIFARMEERGIYNLAFGNVRPDDRFDDDLISDNGDRNKILATVVAAVDKYTQRYPRRWIYFRGNTAAKRRLYRMAVSIHLEELSGKFEILAELEEKEVLVPFQRNMAAVGFLIRRRIIFSTRIRENL
jgi:hypothetical protein